MREESILKVPHCINHIIETVQGSQRRETHEALPTFWQPIHWINTEKGQADRPMQPRHMHRAPFIPENLKSTLETQLFHPLLMISP